MLGAMLGNRKPVPTEKNKENQQAKSGNTKPLKNYDYQEFVDDEEEYDTRTIMSSKEKDIAAAMKKKKKAG